MRKTKSFYVFLFCLLIFAGCQNAAFDKTKANPKIEDNIIQTEQSESENSEEKAVRLAEEFIRKNGYTDEPADKDNLSYESIEFFSNIDELLEQRKNTLEKKAFGIFFSGKGGEKGFTVAFRLNKSRFKDLSDKRHNSLGRSVTMDEKFENLRVEHKDLFLQKVDRKF